MTDETREIFWDHLLMVIKICVGLVVLRVILSYCGFVGHIPVFDDIVDIVLPRLERIYTPLAKGFVRLIEWISNAF